MNQRRLLAGLRNASSECSDPGFGASNDKVDGNSLLVLKANGGTERTEVLRTGNQIKQLSKALQINDVNFLRQSVNESASLRKTARINNEVQRTEAAKRIQAVRWPPSDQKPGQADNATSTTGGSRVYYRRLLSWKLTKLGV